MFENEIVGGSIPREFIAAIEAGIEEAMESGVARRLSDDDIERRRCYDGSYHDVDSSEMAFKIAGSMAFKERRARARDLVLLEPIMEVEVVVPEEYMGDVIGDLNVAARAHREHGSARRRAGDHGDRCPLAEMFGYATRPALDHAGPRQLHDALLALRGGSEERSARRSWREG